jgi:two-component system LytT family response regulator
VSEKKIKTLIVDDEPLARQNIRLLLEKDPAIEIVGECGSGAEAVKATKEKAPDLMFLDIQMPEVSGFGVLEKLSGVDLPVVVFVTAYDQYALKAFEVHAIDYLLKPFNDERFDKALKHAKTQVKGLENNRFSQKLFSLLKDHESSGEKKTAREKFLKRVMVKSAGRVIFLNIDDVEWISAEDYYVKLHTGKKGYLLRETMNDLEAQLDPDNFVRIHRSTIVSIDRIKELHPHFNGDYMVVLLDGTEHKLSRSRREQVQTIITGVSRD